MSNDEPEELIDGVSSSDLVTADALSPTPEQYEELKRGLHGALFKDLKRADRRYLVVGRGDGEAGQRRVRVRDQLDERSGASAFRLEDFGFSADELDVWALAFDVLANRATHVVGVLEDFDGGHVWELGYLYHHQSTVRDILYILKRVYESESETREHYDNGMAASQLAALEEAADERVITWSDPDELAETVEAIP
jgi:hypothetical protein